MRNNYRELCYELFSELTSQDLGDDEYGNFYSEPRPKFKLSQGSTQGGGIRFPPIGKVSHLDRISDYEGPVIV